MPYVLRNIKKLYTGASATPAALLESVDLAVEEGKVHAVRPHDPENEWQGFDTIDASRYFVTPGLVDCHGHVTLQGIDAADLARMEGPSGMLIVERILYQTLVQGGVTSMRDIGGATPEMKRLVEQGILIGPRLRIAICMLSTTGGHADFRGAGDQLSLLWPPVAGRPTSLVDAPWECRKRVRRLAALGADLIKICTSPGVASPSDKLENQDLAPDEIAAIREEATARGLPVASHAHSKSGIKLALEYGVDDIQHISCMDDRLAEQAAEAGVTVTPTSWVIQELESKDDLPEVVKAKAAKIVDSHAEAVAAARRAGLTILAGTDAVMPGMHGRNYREIPALMKDGLSHLEAWYAMTGAAGMGIGLPETGILEEGRRADFLVARDDIIDRPDLLDKDALVEVVKEGIGHRNGLAAIEQRTFRDLAAAAVSEPAGSL